MSERVYIATTRATRADVYHTRDTCPALSDATPQEIAAGTATNNDLRKCGQCERSDDGGFWPPDGMASRLAALDPDDVLGGDPA